MVHFFSKATMLESAHRRPAVKWQDHGWTPLAWDWPSIVQSSRGMYSPTAPVEHTGDGVPLSLMPTAATTGSMVPPVQDIPTPTIPGVTVGFFLCPPSSLVLADCSLLPYQLWQPRDTPIPGTLVAGDWMGDIQTPGPTEGGEKTVSWVGLSPSLWYDSQTRASGWILEEAAVGLEGQCLFPLCPKWVQQFPV